MLDGGSAHPASTLTEVTRPSTPPSLPSAAVGASVYPHTADAVHAASVSPLLRNIRGPPVTARQPSPLSSPPPLSSSSCSVAPSAAARRPRAALAAEDLTDTTNQTFQKDRGDCGTKSSTTTATAAPTMEHRESPPHTRKGPVVFDERGVEADGRNTSSGKAGRPTNGAGAPRNESISSTWKLSAPTHLSSASVLISRSAALQSPASPASPSFAGSAGLSPAAPVAPLFRVSGAFYGSGHVPSFSSVVGNMLDTPVPSSTHGAAAAGTGRARSRSRGVSLPSADIGVTVAGSAVAAASAAPLPQQPSVSEWAAAEERARRAAQAFESDARGFSSNLLDGGDDTVQVARGYRSTSPLSSYDSGEWTATSAAAGQCATVSLRVGGKRRRGSLCVFSNSADAEKGLSGGREEGNGGKEAWSTRLLLASPPVSSLTGVPSPQSPAIPRIQQSNAAATSTSALVRASKNSDRVSPAPGAAVPVAIAATALPSPFHPLLDAFSEDRFGQVGDTAARTTTVALTDGVAAKENDADAATVRPPSWMRVWTSSGLSKQLAMQIERDADVLHVRSVLADPTNSGSGPSRIAAVASTTGSEGHRSDGAPTRPALLSAVPAAEGGGLTAPCSLCGALLQLFTLLEQVEGQVAKLVAGAARTKNDPRAVSPGRQVAAGKSFTTTATAAAAAPLPSNPLQNVKELMAAVMRQWWEVLLPRWPSELMVLGYAEWWLRHSVWDKINTAPASTAASATATTKTEEEEAEVTRSRTASRIPETDQQREQLNLLQEVLAASSEDGMRRLFDAVVDTFILSVQELLRCCGGVGGRNLRELADADADAVWQTRYATAGTRCRGLLRVLTALYLDPPRVLQRVLCETSTHAPSSPPSTTLTDVKAERRSTKVGVDSKEEEGSVSSPASPAKATRPQETSFANASLAQQQQQQQQQRLSEERLRARQLHYQLLYAVCRLCNELPLSWSGATTGSSSPATRNANRAWMTTLMDPSSPSALSLQRCNGNVHHAELFAMAVRLAAAVAAPLRHVQLPMKGDLLCVASRLAQQRLPLLRGGWLGDREYAACMGQLETLLAQAT